MTQPIPYASVDPDTLRKSRRGWLIGFGIVAICIAVYWLAVAAATVVAAVMVARRGGFWGFSAARMVALNASSAAFFLILGLFTAWFGVAMIRCRRWVRPVGIAAAWFWLVYSLVATEMIAANLLADLAAAEDGSLAGEDYDLWFWIGAAIVVILAIGIPLAYLRLLTRPAVADTLTTYDTSPSWTDRFPPPVLTVALWCAALALLQASSAAWPVERFFGSFVTGWNATGVYLFWSALLVAAAIYSLTRPPLGWRLALGACTLYVISMVLTDWLGDARTFFRFSPDAEDLDDSMESWPTLRINNTAIALVCWAWAFWYLSYARPSFHGQERPIDDHHSVDATALDTPHVDDIPTADILPRTDDPPAH